MRCATNLFRKYILSVYENDLFFDNCYNFIIHTNKSEVMFPGHLVIIQNEQSQNPNPHH